jgi:hypothetical protein
MDWLKGLCDADSFFKPCNRCSKHNANSRETVLNFYSVTQQEELCSACIPEKISDTIIQVIV